MHTIHWQVELSAPPAVVRYCKHCGRAEEYRPTGMFRLNAQGKHLDAWMIYGCRRCGNTWNMTLYSRVHPDKLGAELLRQFHQNDGEAVWRYATNFPLIRQNGGEPVTPEFRVTGGLPIAGKPAHIVIESRYPAEIRLAAVLRKALFLSRRELDAWLEKGRIIHPDGSAIGKTKLAGRNELLFLG